MFSHFFNEIKRRIFTDIFTAELAVVTEGAELHKYSVTQNKALHYGSFCLLSCWTNNCLKALHIKFAVSVNLDCRWWFLWFFWICKRCRWRCHHPMRPHTGDLRDSENILFWLREAEKGTTCFTRMTVQNNLNKKQWPSALNLTL